MKYNKPFESIETACRADSEAEREDPREDLGYTPAPPSEPQRAHSNTQPRDATVVGRNTIKNIKEILNASNIKK